MTMPLDLVTVPCLSDNYAFLVHDAESGQTALVDAPEALPILTELDRLGWTLSHILLTHHHHDHIQAVTELRDATEAMVIGAAADAHRLPPLDQQVSEGMTLAIGAASVKVIDVPGHTVGHIAFHIPSAKLAFTADCLMAAGCGRLFEGTPTQMWSSLSKLAALPADTRICSGHEYTTSNIRFALSLDPDNPALILRSQQVATARQMNQPTVPSLLSDEMQTNPFLRAHLAEMKALVGMTDATDVECFAEIRRRKDRF